MRAHRSRGLTRRSHGQAETREHSAPNPYNTLCTRNPLTTTCTHALSEYMVLAVRERSTLLHAESSKRVERQPMPPHDRPVRSISQPGTRASRCARDVQSRKAIEKLLEAPQHAAHDDRPAPASAVDGETIVRLGRAYCRCDRLGDCSCSIATGHARAERQRRAFVVISGQNWPSCSHQEQSSTRLQPRNGGNDLKLPGDLGEVHSVVAGGWAGSWRRFPDRQVPPSESPKTVTPCARIRDLMRACVQL